MGKISAHFTPEPPATDRPGVTTRRGWRISPALLAFALLHGLLGLVVIKSIQLGISGKTAIAFWTGAAIERRCAYQALFALAGLLAVGAALPRLRWVSLLLALSYGAIASHYLDESAIKLAALADGPAGRSADYFEAPVTGYDTPDKIAEMIGIHSQADLAQRRASLVRYIWKTPALPLTEMPVVERDIPDVTDGRLEGVARTSRLTIAMEHGFSAVAHYFEPANPAGPAVIYNHGHVNNHLHPESLRVIAALLRAGRPVLAFSMPNRWPNITPGQLQSVRSGMLPNMADHEGLAYLESPEFSPLKLFLHPLVVGINWLTTAADGPHFSVVDSVGFSGGGWTVTVHAAIDPRVRWSFPVAGTLPTYLQFYPPNTPTTEYEQAHPELMARANYLELYVMGGAGPNRRQLQILNQFDGCCFRGVGSRLYAPVVDQAVRRIGDGGSFGLFLTDSDSHEVAPAALERIVRDLAQP